MTETQIDCFRETKTCVLATANNLMGRPHVFTSYLDIIKWDDDGLIATDSSPICMTLTTQVSVADKHIALAHSLKRLDADKAEACKFFVSEKTTEDTFVLEVRRAGIRNISGFQIRRTNPSNTNDETSSLTNNLAQRYVR